MPRKNRIVSSTGLYHNMLKGIDNRNIFMDDYDRSKFLEILKETVEKESCSIMLYCLMNNHVHLLLEDLGNMSVSMKRIGETYAKYHNKKYQRVGHLFQSRYKSEPVETENHLRVLFTYIHNNPVKAGLIKEPHKYEWSSCKTYYKNIRKNNWLNTSIYHTFFLTREEMLGVMFECKIIYKPSWNINNRWTDDELNMILKHELESFPVITNKKRNNELIIDMRNKTGASYKQLGRVMGISTGIVERICRDRTK
ncbi:MAG: transposase [Firmicutes bacterium HGW-Firmicutes-1]|jgi:REP element-mobilizing transposase RayT|nr:MAG: transposase [Firmicutes bacterium HGW-Firmicutes-1]